MDIADQVAQAEDRQTSRLAADSAELMRWKGRHLLPSRGCKLRTMSLGESEALVEYEVIAAEKQTFDHPGSDAELNVLSVLINGHMVDADEVIHPDVIERWQDELREYEAETAGDDADAAAEAGAEWMREAA